MTRHRIIFIGGAVWELLRFFTLLNVLSLGMFKVQSMQTVIDMAWFGASQLVLAAAFFVTGIDTARLTGLLPLLRIGKLLSVIAGVAALGMGGFAATLLDPPWSAVTSVALLGTLLLDFILLVVLLLYPRDTRS